MFFKPILPNRQAKKLKICDLWPDEYNRLIVVVCSDFCEIPLQTYRAGITNTGLSACDGESCIRVRYGAGIRATNRRDSYRRLPIGTEDPQ